MLKTLYPIQTSFSIYTTLANPQLLSITHDKLIDSIKSTPIIQIGKYELHGVIQEDGIDKPVLVKITQTLYSTMYKLFINNHQIPIRRWK